MSDGGVTPGAVPLPLEGQETGALEGLSLEPPLSGDDYTFSLTDGEGLADLFLDQFPFQSPVKTDGEV